MQIRQDKNCIITIIVLEFKTKFLVFTKEYIMATHTHKQTNSALVAGM